MYQILVNIVSLLEKGNIPYMLTGSLALSLYTTPRATQDIDIVIELYTSQVEHFLNLFDKTAFYVDENEIRKEIVRNGMFNIIELKHFSRIDFIVKNETTYEKHKFTRRSKIQIDGAMPWVISVEDLIISKLQWIQQYQSAKQKEDILNLLALKDLDLVYIRRWIDQLQLNTFELF